MNANAKFPRFRKRINMTSEMVTTIDFGIISDQETIG